MDASVTLRRCHDCSLMTPNARCPRHAMQHVRYTTARRKRLLKEGRCACGRKRGTTAQCTGCQSRQIARMKKQRTTKTYNKKTRKYE